MTNRINVRLTLAAGAAIPAGLRHRDALDKAGFLRRDLRYAGRWDSLETMMRVFVTIVIAALLAACSGPEGTRRGETLAPLSLAQLQADAPVGALPGSPYPIAYELDLTVDPRQARFGGMVMITVNTDAPIRGMYLHGQGLDVTDVRIGNHPERWAQDSALGAWTDVLDTGVAWVDFGAMHGPGEITVTIAYNAPFDTRLSGLFKVTEQGDAFALAKSESIQARRFMPGFDQPAFKAPFNIMLTIPQSDIAISNQPVLAVEMLGDKMKRVRFEITRPLPTYLLSLAVGPFEMVEVADIPPNSVRSRPIPLTGYARRGKGAELAYALEVTPELLEIFEEAYRAPYPYKKMDIIAAPQWPSGATELAAAITYRESRILASDDIGPAARRRLLSIHAHELGHSWFGNLVTPPWWDDLWLKEAFSSWGEGWALAQFEGDPGYRLDAIADGIRAMALDSLGSARAVRQPIGLNENIRNAYDSITYNKGQAVIGMVDAYFGAEVFRPALGRYVEKFEDGVADSPQFFEVIGEETGVPELTEAFRSFVEQNGLPLVRVDIAPGNSAEPVFQVSRYAPLGSEIDSARTWTIPFCFRYGAGGETYTHCELLGPVAGAQRMDGLQPTEHDWIMPNAGGTGYWRFSLPTEMWQALARAFDQLEPGEQMAALDSARAEFAAGRLDVETLWRFIEEGAQAEERRVVAAAIVLARRFGRHVNSDEAALTGYRAQLGEVFGRRFTTLQQRGEDSDDASITRTQLERLLARTARDEARRAVLSNAAAAYIGVAGAESERELSSDDFATALAVAVQDRGAAFLEQLLEAHTEIDDPVFAQAVAYAIGENEDPALSSQILALALNGELGSRESITIVRGQMRQSEVRHLTWDWLQANFSDYVEVIPRQSKRSTPGLARSLCSDARGGELTALFEAYGALAPGHERALVQTRERITLCAALEAAKGDEVRAFFAER